MMQSEIIGRLQNIFDDVFLEPVVVTPQLSAHEVEEWDSLIQISLLVSIEKAFGIRFRVGEVEATRNVGELADLIARRLENS
ncbi:MAG: acyl carrier protein [Pyrinomonadaceae bacterium]|nr:acyl carrier protein [Pyrinomonadaceae bacterium]